MRKFTLVVLGSCLLAGAVVAGPPPAAAPAKPPPAAAAPAPAPAAAAAAAAAAAPAPSGPKKGIGAWMKTLKERFLRRCENPWAPDPS